MKKAITKKSVAKAPAKKYAKGGKTPTKITKPSLVSMLGKAVESTMGSPVKLYQKVGNAVAKKPTPQKTTTTKTVVTPTKTTTTKTVSKTPINLDAMARARTTQVKAPVAKSTSPVAKSPTKTVTGSQGTVAQLWQETTGTSWSEAKKLGLTNGSYDSNVKLMKDLKAGKFDKKQVEEVTTGPLALKKATELEIVRPDLVPSSFKKGGIKTSAKKKVVAKKKPAAKKPIAKKVVMKKKK